MDSHLAANTSPAGSVGPQLPSSETARPEGWIDHPKIPITGRAIAMGIGVAILAVILASASIYFRRTQLEKTTAFWGADAIRSFQLAPKVQLQFDSDKDRPPVDLTGTPGLGHLRHALLEQKHYRWDTVTESPIDSLANTESKLASLTFLDPREGPDAVPTTTIRLELEQGWVGPADREKRVQLIDRAAPAVKHFLTIIRNAEQRSYDFRTE